MNTRLAAVLLALLLGAFALAPTSALADDEAQPPVACEEQVQTVRPVHHVVIHVLQLHRKNERIQTLRHRVARRDARIAYMLDRIERLRNR